MQFTLPQHNVFFSFFIYASSFGAFFSRLADLQLEMQIGESYLGLALVGLPLGVQIALFLADKVLDLISFNFAMCLGIPIMGGSLVLAALSQYPLFFFFSLVLGGLAIGIVEVAVNLEADRTEPRIGKKIMNRSHSFWSLGFFSAGIVGAILSQLQISTVIHFTLSFIISSFLTILFSIKYLPSPKRPVVLSKKPMIVLPTKGVLALVLFTLSAMLIEGAGNDWSIIFMRDVFDTPAFLNGLAFVSGAFAQFTVRFFADCLVERYGPTYVSKISIALMFAGLILVCSSIGPYLALLGFLLMGAGTAVIFPLAMSAAAQKTDRSPVLNVAALAQISFVAFLLGPPLLGFVAENYNIRLSFALGIPFLFLSWIFVNSLRTNANV